MMRRPALAGILRLACFGLPMLLGPVVGRADDSRTRGGTPELLSFADPPADITQPGGRAGAAHSAGDSTARPQADLVLTVAISPRGSLMALGNESGAIELRQREGNRRAKLLTGHTEPVAALDFASNGKLLASGGFDRLVKVWNVEGQAERFSLAGHHDWVRSIAFAPDGLTLATASQDGEVRLWDATSGRLLGVLRGHQASVRALAWSPDGRRLVSGGADRIILVWDVSKREVAARWEGHVGTIRALAWSPDGRTLASGGEDHLVLIRDTTDGHVLQRTVASADQILALAYSARGQGVLAGGYDGAIRVIEVATGRVTESLLGHGEGVVAIALDRTTGAAVSAGLDRRVLLWTPAAPIARLARTINIPQSAFSRIRLSPDGQMIAAYETLLQPGQSSAVRFFEFATGRELGRIVAPAAPSALQFSRDGRRLLVNHRPGLVRLYDVSKRTELANLDSLATAAAGRLTALSPDGESIATVEPSGDLVVWDIASRTRRRSVPAPTRRIDVFAVQGLEYAPGGDRVVASVVLRLEQNAARQSHFLWDLRLGSSSELGRPEDGSSTLTWFADGSLGVLHTPSTGGPRETTLRLYDAATGAATRTIPLAGEPQAVLGRGPDQRRLFLLNRRGSVIVWDLVENRAVGSIRGGRGAAPDSAVLSPDARWLVMSTLDAIKFWELQLPGIREASDAKNGNRR